MPLTQLEFDVVDADSHYYESEDAFVRHVPRAYRQRCVQWATVDGRRCLLVAGRINRFIANPTFDPIAAPGSLSDFFRSKNHDGLEPTEMFGKLDPISDHPEYRVREARLKSLDDQGVKSSFAFPTLGVGMQEAMKDDIDGLMVLVHAFNEWLAEDWGFGEDGRIIGAPMVSLADPDAAVREVEWCAEHGARLICMSAAAIPDGSGGFISPAWPTYDKAWTALERANLPVAFHVGAGISRYVQDWEPADKMQMFRPSSFLQTALHDRMILDLMSALICHGLFDRHPGLRIASIENGSTFVSPLIEQLSDTFGKMPQRFTEHPADVFKRHVWIAPFFEDDVRALRDAVGIEKVLFGSDWPHVEGLAEPLSFIEDVPDFSKKELRLIMRENALAFLG